MRKALLFAAAMIMVGCMSPEERKIAEYIKGKTGQDVSSVEIISSDSVLSLAPLAFMHEDCVQAMAMGKGLDEAVAIFTEYYEEAEKIRDNIKAGVKSKKEGHEHDWRKIDRVRTNGQDIEVVHDVDGSIMMTGREYDQELTLYMHKLLSLE